MADGSGTDSAVTPSVSAMPEATPVHQKHPTHERSAVLARARTRARRRIGRGLGARIFLILLALGLVLGALGLSGRPINLPVWVVAEIEHRLNEGLDDALGSASVSVGAIDVMVAGDWVPRLRLQDLRLQRPGGPTLLTLPDTRLALDGNALLQGQFRASSLTVVGARIVMRRDAAGRLDLNLGPSSGAGPRIDSMAAFFDAADRLFAVPALANLRMIEAEALSLSLTDARVGRTWEVGDGRLRLENREGELAAELGMTLVADAAFPARAVLTLVTEKSAARARITATVDQVPAADLAAQTALLGWLEVLDAPISGELVASLDATGLTALEGRLALGAGAVQPSPTTSPIPFDHVNLELVYDPARGSVRLTGMDVESKSFRLKASGHSYLVDDRGQPITGPLSGRRPAAFLGQLAMTDIRVDPEGLFQAPVGFATGALDVRLALDPFVLDIGQLSLSDPERRLSLSGRIAAEPDGWLTAFDVSLDQVTRDGLLRLWPLTAVPATRAWIERNLLQAMLSDVTVAFRDDPATEPRLHLSYGFTGARLRVLPTLPPVDLATGYATVAGQTYTLALTKGQVMPPEGGAIDVAGSVFSVPDISTRNAKGHVRLISRSSLTAMLSLLDEPPFRFLTKALLPVTLGQGEARLETVMTLPLGGKLTVADVDYTVTGRIIDFATDVLVPGKTVSAPELSMTATPEGLTVAGQGQIGVVPFDVTLSQAFAKPATEPDAVRSVAVLPTQVDGTITLSPDAVAEFGLGLPDGMISGAGPAQVSLSLPRGGAGRLRLVSDLNRIGLAIPELGWTKPPGTLGELEVEARLGPTPRIETLRLAGAGLEAAGSVTLRPGGGLDVAQFTDVRLNNWLDADVTITGQGAGRPVALAVTSGFVDLRRMPERRGKSPGGKGGPLTLTLDRLQVSDGIALNRFRGAFSLAGGLNGDFRASVNGQTPILGALAPSRGGTAVRITAADAGAVMAAAGVFSSAVGGSLELQLIPRPTPGHYDGRADIRDIRVRDANVLAALLNAVSVVGILEQLDGDGIVFGTADADFLLTPDAIQVTRGAAIGASLGVTMAGLYGTSDKRLRLQGVISPIYLLNGVGAVVSRRGEGLFGFNYSLSGTADAPEVSVNPLSILTPGMFREIFRRPPPVLSTVTPETATPAPPATRKPVEDRDSGR